MKTAILTLALALRLAARVALAALLLLLIAAAPARADKCNDAKIKAIGKKESGLLGCSAKEATKTGAEPACDSSISGKFSTAYNKPTGCSPAAPSEMTCETAADTDCQTAIRALLPDGNGTSPSKCEAARLKAAGKLASAELGCIAKAAAKNIPVVATCISGAEGKFAAAFNKPSGCTGDGNASGIQTEVENDCVNNVVDVSGGNFVAITCGGPPPTTTTTTAAPTTTTTTTTSTTTTTLDLSCSAGQLCPDGRLCCAGVEDSTGFHSVGSGVCPGLREVCELRCSGDGHDCSINGSNGVCNPGQTCSLVAKPNTCLGAPDGTCLGATEFCCGAQLCCSTNPQAPQTCGTNPTPHCITTCPQNTQPCSNGTSVDCCVIGSEACINGTCKTSCGLTTCFRDTQTCCTSFCCDAATEVCINPNTDIASCSPR